MAHRNYRCAGYPCKLQNTIPQVMSWTGRTIAEDRNCHSRFQVFAHGEESLSATLARRPPSDDITQFHNYACYEFAVAMETDERADSSASEMIYRQQHTTVPEREDNAITFAGRRKKALFTFNLVAAKNAQQSD